MSEARQRDQFRTLLKCGRCGAAGHAIWEENSGTSADGPMGSLITMSDSFILQVASSHQGQPLIACKACGTVHPD